MYLGTWRGTLLLLLTVAVSTFLRGQPRYDEWEGFRVSLGFVYKRQAIPHVFRRQEE
jgi:hypothetical protein